MNHYDGFTLVELMITVAILAILAAVAIPAYSNYINRAKQSDAIIGLKAAQMAQEQYFSENNAYCSTINWLPGFSDGTVDNSYKKGEYTLSASATGPSFEILATSSTLTDRWKIDHIMINPEADTNSTYPGIKGYSVFSWLFD
ncbi:MAG: prepilin-type N-terminal cleavage/methylation domain-containing protein [Deltaproteobacteria bacterium]|nr:prepilin-type N-terminal cleavage/methylation domain-containing protein [Candidatus Tharpella aukensis]